MSDLLQLRVTNETKHIQEPVKAQGRFNEQEKGKIAESAIQFESLMTQMMLKSMTETTGGMFGDSDSESGEGALGGDVFEGLFLDQLSQFMTRSGSNGIAEQIYKKMTGEDLPSEVKVKSPNSGRSLNLNSGDAHRVVKKLEHDLTKLSAVVPSARSLDRIKGFEDTITKMSEQFGVPTNLVRSIILAESAGNPRAFSHANAKGLMQLMDGTAQSMGVKNPWNPEENIYGGTKYISQMLEKFGGDTKLALAAYNAGPGNVEKYNGIPPFKETQQYVARVMGYMKYFENGSES